MRVAITVTGLQDSGKSSTMKGLVNNYCDRRIRKRVMSGGRAIYLNQNFHVLNLWIYFFASSCSEMNTPISKRLTSKKLGLPEFLWVAVQKKGHLQEDTLSFLKNNDYEIIPFILSNQDDDGIWGRFNPANEEWILGERANSIIKEIKGYISDNNLTTP